jgi:hypothetical protein
VTILPWKLDAVYCASLKVGAPQVALAASLRELLIACESRLISADSRRGRRRRCRMAGGLRLMQHRAEEPVSFSAPAVTGRATCGMETKGTVAEEMQKRG